MSEDLIKELIRSKVWQIKLSVETNNLLTRAKYVMAMLMPPGHSSEGRLSSARNNLLVEDTFGPRLLPNQA